MAAALIVIGLVSGCEGVMVYEPMYTQLYSNGSFDYAARNGVMKTEIVGDPFGGAPNFAEKVTDYLYGATRSVPVKFALQPQGTGSAPYHVVMIFNAPAGATSDQACAQRVAPAAGRSPDAIHVLAAFCSGDLAMSEAGGRAAGVTGPDDPKFRSLVRQVAYGLIPPYDRRDVGASGSGNTP
jgi:hypothetical protein